MGVGFVVFDSQWFCLIKKRTEKNSLTRESSFFASVFIVVWFFSNARYLAHQPPSYPDSQSEKDNDWRVKIMHTKKKAKEITFCFLILIELKRQNTNRPFLKSPRNGNWTKILRNWTFSIESYIVRRKDKKLKTKARKKMNTNVHDKKKKEFIILIQPSPLRNLKTAYGWKNESGFKKTVFSPSPCKTCALQNYKLKRSSPPRHQVVVS